MQKSSSTKNTEIKKSSTFLKSLESEVRKLSHSRRLAFAASCCERAYPNYVAFFQHTHWGGPATLRAALNKVWDFVEGSIKALADISELEQKCAAVTPDLDDFSTSEIDVQAGAAQEAAFMVRLLLQFCRDNQVSYAVRITTFARDTIDMYIQVAENLDPSDPELDAKIAQNPLMRQEIRNQESDLLKLSQIKTPAELQQFRRCAMKPERSNIGLMPQQHPS